MTTTADRSGDNDPSKDPKAVDDEDDSDEEDDHLVFNLYSADSWDDQLLKEKLQKEKEEENKRNQGEAHLVDGELQFDSEEHHGPAKKRNPNLIEGNTLMEDSGLPKEYYGKPIEELDRLILDKTFCVIAPRFKKEYINRFSSTRSFFLLPPWNALRRSLLYIATNQYFDYFIILTILTNCVFLAMPEEPVSETVEYAFLAIYSVEMIIKMLARGLFINSYTYLRDAWNWLDFIVIVTAYITIVLENSNSSSGLGNLQGIRTFRVFRVLRTVSIVPGLKTMVNALLRAFRMLLEVMMLIVFCLMVFALFSLQIYMGVLRQKCVADPPSYNGTLSYTYDQYYNDYIKNSTNWFGEEDDYQVCGNASNSRDCPDNYTCLPDIGENPNFGYTGFDHFGWAMLTSFQLITLDFWEDSYNKVLQSVGPWNVIFFVFVVFFGSFYLLNLMLAVVAMSYEEEAKATGKMLEKRKKEKARKARKKASLSSNSSQEEKEKEAKNREKQKRRKKKKKDKEKEKDELKELALSTNRAVKRAVDSVYPPTNPSKIAASSTVRPLGNPSEMDRKHIQRKPMVKMPSKDSGTGNSVESSRSNGSKDGDYLITEDGSYSSSTLDMIKKDKPPFPRKPLVKQASQGILPTPRQYPNRRLTVVSSSGVALTQEKGSSENIVDLDTSLDDQSLTDQEKEKATMENERPGRKYVADHYPGLVIIDVDKEYDVAPENQQLMNRNCNCCYDCCGGHLFVGWLKFQAFMFSIASEPLFDLFITLCIVFNTLFMTLEHHNQPEALDQLLNITNIIFTVIFTLEAVIKISAFTKHYFKTGWNIFDLVIVVASLLDLGLSQVDGLSVFRTFRLLRVFKLAQSWPTMRLLLSIIMNTLGALANLTAILGIVIYIFAVIGLQLFNKAYTADKFGGEDNIPRWNFNDIFHSFMMIFRVLCGEWIEPLWDCMRASGELCMAVFLPTLIIGYFIVLNLFLALLLNAFASDSLDKEANEESKLMVAFRRLRYLCCFCIKKKDDSVNSVGPDDNVDEALEKDLEKANGVSLKPITNGTDQKKQPNGVVAGAADKTNPKKIDTAFDTKRDQYADFNKAMAAAQMPRTEEVTDETKAEAGSKDKKDKKEAKPGVRLYTIPAPPKVEKKSKEKNKVAAVTITTTKPDSDELELGAEASTIKHKDDEEEEKEEDKVIEVYDCFPVWLTKRCRCYWAYDETSCGLRWFHFRAFINRIVDHKIFEGAILFLIAASSVSLAFEDVNLYANADLTLALFCLNIIFATLFTIEMLLKWVAFGFKKYFTSFWTILDFCIVVISVASLVAEAYGAANFSAFRSLRTLRALRPLRAISRWQGMRIVVNALMMAIPSIVNVLFVCLIFWLIFSIMGVQFFKGKFYKCIDSSGEKVPDTSNITTKAQCLANATLNYSWKNSNINFDNVGNGYLALMQVATFEGWMEVMIDAVDSVGIDEQPMFESSLYSYLYFVAFIVFGAFFTLNLFIGVIIDNFNALKKKYDGSYLDMFLTSGQRQYYNTIKKLGNKKPQKTIKRPKNKTQGAFYDIAISSKFELCIVIVIFLNMIVMAVEHYKQTDTVTDVLAILNILFVVIFALEAIVKIVGLRWHYFRQAWNIFDFIVVLLSLVGIILDDILSSVFVTPTLLRVVRVFRIGRVLRLIKAAKGIRKLLFALIISLPALFNIGMLLFLIMYIYSIICLSTFQNLKVTGALDDDVVNFKTFVNSFMLMFRLSTAAGWNDILETMLLQPPDCNNTHYQRPDGEWIAQDPGDCGTPYMAVLALTSYIIIIFLVVINMFIAVILENFNQAHEQEEVGITEDDFDMFYAVWERYDPLATQFIKYEQLSNFVADLEPPLGIAKPNEIALVSFDLPIVEGDKLHCLDVLMGLVRYVLGNVEDSPEFRQLHEQMELRFQSAFPTRVNTTRKSTTMSRKKEDVAAKTLQRAWRSWKAQKQMKNIAALAMQHQNQKKSNNSIDSRNSKTNGLRSLGVRLSTALGHFFSSSRPSSAISRLSVRSVNPEPSTSSTNNGKKKKPVKSQGTLQVPSVSILYSEDKDADIEL